MEEQMDKTLADLLNVTKVFDDFVDGVFLHPMSHTQQLSLIDRVADSFKRNGFTVYNNSKHYRIPSVRNIIDRVWWS